MEATRQLCTFKLDALHCAVELRHVQEIMLPQELTPVPLAPGSVAGLINLRGTVVTAIDLRTRLGLAVREEDAAASNLVVNVDRRRLSLLVDEIGDVVEVDPASFEPPPKTLGEGARRYVEGVYKLDDGLLLLLDLDRTADLD